MMPPVTETFTCASCGDTFDKGWSDEEAAAEAEEFFPGINVTDPAEAGVVCDGCYQHIMGRTRAEAPEMIGPGWRAGRILDEAAELGITQEELDREEADMFSTPPGYIPGVGAVPGLAMRMLAESSIGPFRRAHPDSKCYRTDGGLMVHVKPGCRCR
jgi:hypothetical protein